MPAHHTTVAAGITAPDDSVTPRPPTAATRTPVMVSTLFSPNAASMTGRAESPISDPTYGLWSTRITRGVAAGPSASDSIFGSSLAVSIPVRPAPTTTAVAVAGSAARA